MLKSLIKALGIVAGLALSGFACAVSLGGINVTTALGEPLKAGIVLETSSIAEANSLTARMATPDAFKNAGVDYPYSLPVLTFLIEVNPANGEASLKITSVQPVNEPFVNLLVELGWPSGKLLREYTFLLDPPGYVVEQPKAAEVQLVEPSVEVPPPIQAQGEEVEKTPEPVSQSESAGIPSAVEEKEPAEPEPVAASEPAKSSDAIPDTIKVRRGDTLSKLAAQVKSSDISLERMLIALYRANADAFDGKNMNRLKAGKILKVPDQADLENLEQAEAVQEIRVQAADWNAYRQKLAAASNQVINGTPKQEVSGKINTQVEDKTPAAKESAKEVVRLSKGEAPGDKAAAGGSAKSTQNKAQTQQEEAIAKNKTIQESNERVAMLEKNIKAMQRLAELKSKMVTEQAKPPAGADKSQPGKLGALPKMATPLDSSVSAVAASSAVQSAKTLPNAEVVAVQPSILDAVLEQPLYLAGLAAALLGLAGFGLARRRRANGSTVSKIASDRHTETKAESKAGRRIAALFEPILGLARRMRRKGSAGKEALDAAGEEDVGSATGRILAPVAPSPETGDFTKTLVSKTAITHAPTDEVDPISEADLFLNFGRDEQAEEILKEALGKNPANHLIRLKLLSIYAKREDTKAFSAMAMQVKDSGDAMAWDQAVAMGIKLEPNNPLYGGSAPVAGKALAEKASAMPVGTDTMVDVGAISKQVAAMDFDLGVGTMKMPTAASAVPAAVAGASQGQAVALEAPMDFDITGSHTNMTAPESKNAESSEVQLDDLIFDVTVGGATEQPSPKAHELAADEPKESISYLLDFPGVTQTETISPQAAISPALEMGLGKINLNLDEPVPPVIKSAPETFQSQPEEDAHWEDVATKLDLAKAYQEMGDGNGAREILEEVVRDGNEQQRNEAEALLQALPT